jgi:hypothetical protein
MARFGDLVGLTLSSVEGLISGSECITFNSDDGKSFQLYSDPACRSRVEIVDVYGDILDLVDNEIVLAEERTSPGPKSFTSSTWSFYEIATNRGSVTIRWLGSSNGYYSETVSFRQTRGVEVDTSYTPAIDGVYEVNTVWGREWWLWNGENWLDFDGTVLDPDQAESRFTVLGPALKRN